MTGSTFDILERHGCQHLFFCSEPSVGLRAIIALHDTTPGAAAGGIRMKTYASEEEALTDAVLLARAMTSKFAAAGIPWGGGKCVVIGDPARQKTPELLRALGRSLQRLKGLYIAGEDVGTNQDDMRVIRQQTSYIVVPPEKQGEAEGGTTATALGVVQGMRACAQQVYQQADLRGRKVAVQGLGAVGSEVVRLLLEAGAQVMVADIDPAKVQRLIARWPVQVVSSQTIHQQAVDIFCPCALGGVLNEQAIPQMRCKIVCGSANNQLAEERLHDLLEQREIIFAPDYIVNAGAAILNYDLYQTGGRYQDEAWRKIERIFETVKEVLALAREQHISTSHAADQLVQRRLQQMRQIGSGEHSSHDT
jgi:leucine dehydrogenase